MRSNRCTLIHAHQRTTMNSFLEALRTQRWDDHRYYHHSRINQSLHFVSATSFLIAYALIFFDPLLGVLIGWLVSMTTRQAGHFFFEPKTYDHINQATHDHKEEIKVGYNLNRKVVLMTIWAVSPRSAVHRSRPVRPGHAVRRRPASSSATLPGSGLRSASAACCSAPCTCSSSTTSRPASCG